MPSLARADVNQNAVNQQDWIIRQQQNFIEEKKRDAEFDTIKKERERNQKEQQQSKTQAVTGKMSGACVKIQEIRLLNAKSLSFYRQKKLVAPFIDKCMEAETLAAIIKQVNEYYHSQGFVTTQVKVPKQNLQSGVFELEIIEGKIEKITLGKDHFIEKMQKFTAFGAPSGEVLNINDINQGIYQINRLQSNSALMKIEPGSAVGDSKIVVDNNKNFPAKFTIGKDNLGSKFTGEQRTNFSSSFDNLLFLNDNINLSYTTNYHDDNSIKDLKSFSSGISIPFKYNTFSYDFYRSEFKGQNAGVVAPTTLTGYSQSSKFTLDHVFLNNAKLRLSASSSLTAKQSASYLESVKINTSERKLSILNLSVAASAYFNDSTSLYLKPSYSQGLKILNAKQDTANESGTTPKAQFEYFKLYANFSKRFTIPQTQIPVTFASEIDSQYAKQTLYGSEQFSVGGYYSVRGFRENYITGDSGYYVRNKINVNLSSLLSPFTQNVGKNPPANSGFFTKNLAQLSKISFEPFYDYGYTKYKYVDGGADGRLAGAGLKTIFNSKYFTSSLTYSWATNKSRLVSSTIKENKMLYFEISTSCC